MADDEDAWDDESTESSSDSDHDEPPQNNEPQQEESRVEKQETSPTNSGEGTGGSHRPTEPPVACPGKKDDVASKDPVAKGEGSSSSSAGSSTALIDVSVQLRLLQNTKKTYACHCEFFCNKFFNDFSMHSLEESKVPTWRKDGKK